VAAIVAEAEIEDGRKIVCVTRAIQDAVLDALQAAYPKRMIIYRPIVEPGQSLRETTRPDIDLAPSRDGDAIDRAAERISQMREGA
jgi:hypothetical protein